MMTVRAHQHQRGRPIGAVARMLLPIVLTMSVTALFAMVWQSVDKESDFAALERDGIRYIQVLGPLGIALTNAGSAAIGGSTTPPEDLRRAIDAVAGVDRELGERLTTQDRWAGLRAKIEGLPDDGSQQEIVAAYGTVSDLLLALMDKVRNSSQLIRDPSADLFYLSDGAAQELPESIAAATRYTNLLLTLPELSAADRADTIIDISTAASNLAGNARDLSDDVRLAVESTGSEGLGGALLSRLDRYNRAVDNLLPLANQQQAGRASVNTEQVGKLRDEMQSAAADLSAALLTQIDLGLNDRISALDQRRLLALGILVLSVLLALTPIGLLLANRNRSRRTSRPAAEMPAQGPWPTPGPQPADDTENGMRRRISVP